MSNLIPTLLTATALAAAAAGQTQPAVPHPTYLIRTAKLLPMAGPPIERGELLIHAGKILAVGRDLPLDTLPPDTTPRELDCGDLLVMPGLVELHCHVGVDGGINDSVIPHNMDLRTLDMVLQDSPELADAMASGVTTALIIPGSGSTIGGLGTLVKTAGPDFAERLIRFPGALKIALHARGGNPARRAGDLGSTRLGLHHMLKVVMAQARDYHQAWTQHEAGQCDRPEFSPRLEPLRGLFRREFPVILHAYGQNDTMTAIRILQRGLGLPIVISHGVYDSFKIGSELAASGAPMNIGPRQFEFYESRFIGNANALHRAGVRVSICTDAPVVAQDQLALQAAMAVRLGFPESAALRGLTIEPARAIGIDNRVGALQPGLDADLIAVTGDPLDPRNRPRLVMIDGRVVLDQRRVPK